MAAAGAATSAPASSPCCSPRSRRSSRCATSTRRPAASTRRPWRTRRSAGRCTCAAPTVRAEKVRTEAESALYRFINPITGGPDGQGWPFDLDLSIGDVFSVLRAVPGVQRAETVHIFLADLRGDLAPEEARQRIRLSSEALFMSVRHRVVVRQ